MRHARGMAEAKLNRCKTMCGALACKAPASVSRRQHPSLLRHPPLTHPHQSSVKGSRSTTGRKGGGLKHLRCRRSDYGQNAGFGEAMPHVTRTTHVSLSLSPSTRPQHTDNKQLSHTSMGNELTGSKACIFRPVGNTPAPSRSRSPAAQHHGDHRRPKTGAGCGGVGWGGMRGTAGERASGRGAGKDQDWPRRQGAGDESTTPTSRRSDMILQK